MINYQEVPKPYWPLVRGIETLPNSEINAVISKSKKGLGKSFWTDYALNKINAEYVIFKGTISESRFFKFVQDNSNKIIVMRDCGSMLRRLTFLDFLKSATDPIPVREISRLNYARHEGVEDTFNFTGKLIWEINAIPKKNKEDLAAVIDRSLFINLNLCPDEIKKIMLTICKSELETEVTNYLISKLNKIGLNNFNFRNQYKSFQIVKCAMDDKLNWKSQLDLFLDAQVSEARRLLYRFAGLKQVKRMAFVKYLISQGWSYATAQRRIMEFLLLEEIYSNGKLKQSLISLNPILNISNISEIKKQ